MILNVRQPCTRKHVCTEKVIIWINFVLLLQTSERKYILENMTFIELVSFFKSLAFIQLTLFTMSVFLSFKIFTISILYLTFTAHTLIIIANISSLLFFSGYLIMLSLLKLCSIDKMGNECEAAGGVRIGRRNWSTATLPTINPTLSDLRSNLGLHSEAGS
jgi:hypothetical protein